MSGDEQKIGASKANNKTISEIMEFLSEDGHRPSAQQRAFLRKKLADLGNYWYKRGFNRGHRQSLKQFQKSGRVRSKLSYKGEREFFTGQTRQVRLKSTVRRKAA